MLYTQTMNLNKEFRRLYYKGKSYADPVLVTYVMKSRSKEVSKIGITASKKIGKAVARNRARRIIKEAYRQLEPSLAKGWDFVFVARTRTVYSNMNEVKSVMEKQLQKAGVLL